MKNICYILLCHAFITGISFSLSAQQVIGCFGVSKQMDSGIEISATAGESVISTETSATYQLTQGFHQPLMMTEVSFDIVLLDASCPTSTDGGAKVENIRGSRPPYAITWSVGDVGPKIGRLAPGTYAVTVSTRQSSFTRSFTIVAASEDECLITFFKAFSPNGDGKNDGWYIENIQRPEFSDNNVEIFNRWGQRIWEAQGYNNDNVKWMGNTQKGGSLPDGTYFFVARIADVIHKGYVELTR